MKRFLFVFLLFTANSHAGPGLELNSPHIYDLLPEGGELICDVAKNPKYGYVLKRGQGETGKEVKVFVINAGVNEGEKTAQTARVEREGLDLIYLKHFRRWQNIGSYMEFQILRQPLTGALIYFPGSVAFTTSIFTPGDDGKENEDLIPEAKSALRCRFSARR